MLYLLGQLGDSLTAFNVFRYITFRTAGAVVTALFFVFLFGPGMIASLKIRQGQGQPIREDGPASHLLTKKGKPTMGGLMILAGAVISILLWANLANVYVWAVLFVTIGFGAIGFYDDYLKVTRMSHKGFAGWQRLCIEAIIALIAGYIIASITDPDISNQLMFPFIKGSGVPLSYAFYIFAAFIIVGAGNSVNFTDGLVVCGALIGAGLGFLWFNAPPAQIIMGDTGSLALGGAIGTIAVATKHELVLAIIGGLFVLETVSVIVQVVSFKLTGKRVFKMAPIHHHFELLGWTESQVVIRFWIISFVLALIGLSSLKLR